MARSVAAVAFLAGSTATPPFVPLACTATLTSADTCAVVGFPGGGSSTTGHEKKQEGPHHCCPFCVALPTVDARMSTPPEYQATAAFLSTTTTSTLATSSFRGYRLLGVNTDLYPNRIAGGC